MNETIGVKGGKNDLRRRYVITKKMKERLEKYHQEQKEKELLALEKKVKSQQFLTLLASVPIATVGQIYTTLTKNPEKEKALALKEAIDLIEKENIFSEKDTTRIITALKEGNIFSLDEELLGKLGLSIEGYKRVSEIDLTDFEKQPSQEEIIELAPDQQSQISSETKAAVLNVVELTLQEKQEKLLQPEEKQEIEPPQEEKKKEEEISTYSNETQVKAGVSSLDVIDQKLDKLKNHKIVDEYEKKLKDVRVDLRQLIFEYNLVSEASNHLYDSKEAEELLERLNEIIKKIEQLKRRIDIPDIDKYDDNYLYTLIENYIEEFKNKKFVDEIKDSALYIMISDKLNELDSKKDILQDKIETKKTKLELDEMRIEQVRETYYDYEKINSDLVKFQQEQDYILNEIKEKMANATTVQERVEVQVVGMQRQSRRLLTLLAASMMLPGARSAKGLATLTATYLYFMRNIMRPRTETRRYKTIKVEDFSKEIESSITELENISSLLTKTSRQIDRTINNFEKEFKEYLDVIPECRHLLADLEKIKDEIAEKEFEIIRIKEEQKRNLEKNDAKVKMITQEYPV